MRALLVGNYGVGNLGDEALKDYFLRAFPAVSWTVVSARPGNGEVPRLPGGVRSLLTTPWWRTLRAYRAADAIVFGGGTLLTDVESSYACFLWFLHACAARALHKPLLLAFQGIGPFRTRRGEALARWVARRSPIITVRDAASARRIEAWNLNTEVVQSFDPILKEIYDKNEVRSQKVFTIIPRRNSHISFREAALERARGASRIAIVSLAPDDPAEREVCRSLASLLPSARVEPVRTLGALAEAVGRASFVLTERYHGAIAALALGVPFATVAQGREDKLEEIAAVARGHALPDLLNRVARGEDALRRFLG